jgi:hypothetical protein
MLILFDNIQPNCDDYIDKEDFPLIFYINISEYKNLLLIMIINFGLDVVRARQIKPCLNSPERLIRC